MAGDALLLTLLGAVALLLSGVRMVRRGMMRAFGLGLRVVLAHASKNRITAFLGGIIIAGILQNSIATALLLASFATRGLVTLPIALATMLGAGVGTTLVAQAFSGLPV
jgi:phosphate:Na+ symporter